MRLQEKFFFSISTLYLAYSRWDIGNLALEHSVLHFSFYITDITFGMAELNATHRLPERENKKNIILQYNYVYLITFVIHIPITQ